jgi:tRNA A-37 threonylcarbamoyl transferase component Bud32
LEDADPLRQLIGGIADGTLDRERLPGTHPDPSISQLLVELQLLAGLSEVHRSEAIDDSTRLPERAHRGAMAAQSVLASSSLGPGSTWGNFELLKKIGEGSFGEVFLARDLWLGHDVALKVLRATITDRARMLQEARMLVRVRHPHVVTVHGADVHGGRLGFWMDFVDGVTLNEVIARDGRRSAGEARAWGQDLCRALAAVHAAGIVHRDVKGQNVMRQAGDGQLILMDFGAGEMLDAPRLGEAAGTPLYLAPELLDGAAATKRSDIYALGVLLFYVVSRRFPLEAESWGELIQAHQHQRRVRLEDIRPDLPPSFVETVERALESDPAARFGSAGEMLAGLRIASSDTGPLHVRPAETPTPVAPAPLLLRQAAVQVASGAAALAALAFGLGFIACFFFESDLNIDPDFAAGPSEYWRVGRQALFPMLLVWVTSGAVVAGLGSARYLLRSPISRLQRAWRLPVLESFNPLLLGALLLTAGMLAFLAIVARFSPVYAALEALRTNSVTPATIAAFEPSGANTDHGLLSALLSFLLGFAAWKWFPWLENRDPSATALRSLRWATVGVAALVLAASVIPRRVIWDEFEVVQYENRRAVVLGVRGDELLLYVPDLPSKPRRRVTVGAAGLERTGNREKLFKPS